MFLGPEPLCKPTSLNLVNPTHHGHTQPRKLKAWFLVDGQYTNYDLAQPIPTLGTQNIISQSKRLYKFKSPRVNLH